MAACPNVGPKEFNVGAHGNSPHVNFHGAPQQIDTKKHGDKTKPGGPTEQMSAAQRDQRAQSLKPRVRALLITEIQGLESLWLRRPAIRPTASRSPGASRKPTSSSSPRHSATRQRPRSARTRIDADKAQKVLLLARQNSIKYYGFIKEQYASYPKLDEVLYYLAYEYEQAQDIPNALKVYTSSSRRRRPASTSQRVPRVRRAVLRPGPGRPLQVRTRQTGLQRGHQVSGAG